MELRSTCVTSGIDRYNKTRFWPSGSKLAGWHPTPLFFCAKLIFLCLVVSQLVAEEAGPVLEARGKPNIVIILADDMGYSDLGRYGGEIATPHLDSQAKNGLRFIQFYNTARCWPTRGALLTSYYAQQINRDALPGMGGVVQGTRQSWARLLPDFLKPAGYRSYHSGKWHIDGKLELAWQRQTDSFTELVKKTTDVEKPKAEKAKKTQNEQALNKPISYTTAADGVADDLIQVVQKQSVAWNRGDIAEFMSPYWKDERLTFSSGGKTKRGWQATYENYKKNYPDSKTMGKLTFSELETQELGPDAILMLGTWHLDRDEPVGGNFSLIWKRIDGKWVIVHDHSSALKP